MVPFNRQENAMSRPRANRSAKTRKAFLLQKPTGQFTPRVQAVGPEHFGRKDMNKR
jgi:hypothetical protein